MFKGDNPIVEISSESNLEEAMKEYCTLDFRKDDSVAKLRAKVNELNEDIERKVRPIRERLDALYNLILDYAEANKETLLDGKKSRSFQFGLITFRQWSRVEILARDKKGNLLADGALLEKLGLTVEEIEDEEVKTTMQLVETLPKKRRETLLIVDPKVSKTALKKLDEADLLALNAAVITEDSCTFKPARVVGV